MQHSPYHQRRTVNGTEWYSRTVQPHPTLTQAARRIKQHSPRDLREILRISRLAPIGKAFRADGDQERYTTKYKKLWQAYLDQRSMDLVIVFE
ncbi:hypothetical protein PISMIDRAFT_686291, partial [Pisolithus microcarpus 441]